MLRGSSGGGRVKNDVPRGSGAVENCRSPDQQEGQQHSGQPFRWDARDCMFHFKPGRGANGRPVHGEAKTPAEKLVRASLVVMAACIEEAPVR
ncbi:protein of unknown function [Aminobacter niigataensis]|nr:protein of unknown function [Aminobacter niigataensis]